MKTTKKDFECYVVKGMLAHFSDEIKGGASQGFQSKYLNVAMSGNDACEDEKYYEFVLQNCDLFPESQKEALQKLDAFLLCEARFEDILWKKRRQARPALIKGVPTFFVENIVCNGFSEGWFVGKNCGYGVADKNVEFLFDTQWIHGAEKDDDHRCFFNGRSFLYKETKFITARQAMYLARDEYEYSQDELVPYYSPMPIIAKNDENNPFWLLGSLKGYPYIKVLANAFNGLIFIRSKSDFDDRFELAAPDDDRFCYE